MDQNTPLSDRARAAQRAEHQAAQRAENATYSVAALRKFVDISLELANLIVDQVRTAATAAAAATPPPATPGPAAPARRADPAHDVDLLFRAARRGVLLSDKLLAPPRPERAPAAPRTAPPAGRSSGHHHRADHDRLDRLDTIDRLDQLDKIDDLDDLDGLDEIQRLERQYDIPPLPRTPGEKILKLRIENNITHPPGTADLFDRPVQDVVILSCNLGPAISKVLKPFGLMSAGGFHPPHPPDSS